MLHVSPCVTWCSENKCKQRMTYHNIISYNMTSANLSNTAMCNVYICVYIYRYWYKHPKISINQTLSCRHAVPYNWPLFWKRAKRHRCTKSFPVRWWRSVRYLSNSLRPSHHNHHIFSVKICTSPCSMACSYIFRFVPAWFLFSFTRISALPFLTWKSFLFQSPSPRLVRRLMTLSSRLGTGKTKVSISKSLRSQITWLQVQWTKTHVRWRCSPCLETSFLNKKILRYCRLW